MMPPNSQKSLQSISESQTNGETSTSKLFYQNELRHLIRDKFGNDMYIAIGQSENRERERAVPLRSKSDERNVLWLMGSTYCGRLLLILKKHIVNRKTIK